MKTVLKNLSLLTALLVVVYLVANYAESTQSRLFTLLHLPESAVKGASTERAQELSEKFKSDLSIQMGVLEEQALNFTLGDAITFFSRLQKIPQDFNSIKEYTSDQIENFTKKK